MDRHPTTQELLAEIATLHGELEGLRRGQESSLPAQSEGWYQRIFEQADVGIVCLAPDGRLLRVNRRFAFFLGYPVAELLGKNVRDITASEDFQEELQGIGELLSGTISRYNADKRFIHKDGAIVWGNLTVTPLVNRHGTIEMLLATITDIDSRKIAEEVSAHRLLSLTRPLSDTSAITFADLFPLAELQLLQDQFAEAFGVASIITHPDGTPITRPSNFTRLCRDLIRLTSKGNMRCRHSDALLGQSCANGPRVQTCLSAGLWDAAATISVDGHHLANWLIGQVRDQRQSEEAIRLYAREIGVDADEAAAAFAEVPAMSRERFERVATLLFSLANRLSSGAYQNLQQARFITELKEAQEQLRASEGRLRFALQGANDGLWDADLRGSGEVYFSDRAMEILGYAPKAGTKNVVDWRRLIHRDDFERIWRKMVDLFKMRSPILVDEIRLQKEGGGWKWVLVRGKVVSWADEWALRLTGTMTDINHHKQLEQTQLFLLEADGNQGDSFFHHLATFLATILDMEFVCIDKLSGDKLTAHTLALLHDGSFHDNLSYTLKDTPCGSVVRENICVFPSGVQQLFPKDEVLRELAAESYLGVSLRDSRSRAVGLIAAMSRRPLQERETAEAILTLVAIRTAAELERRETEEERERLHLQLLQAQKMESVGRLAGGVAHDFNNMLGVILGHVEMIEDQLVENDPITRDLHGIKEAAGRSADLTKQLLAFARKQTVLPRVLDLNHTVGGLIKMLKRLIGEDVHLSWKPADDLWPVLLDPSQIDQMLANLTINARDAIAGTGQVVIETANASIDADYCASYIGLQPGDYVLLSVSDDGCGMDPQTQEHIFEPFFTTKEVGRGTGLGLATIYGIVKQNGGYIDVSSARGRGSTFRLFFPRHHGEVDKPRQGMEQAAAPGQETILVVEDEPSILTIGKRMLEKLGYTVLAASSPTEAEELAATHQGGINLLLTDVIMPEMNGHELAQRLSKHRPDMALLFMSGYTADVIAHHGVLDQGVHFIQKPFSKVELAAKVRQALEGN